MARDNHDPLAQRARGLNFDMLARSVLSSYRPRLPQELGKRLQDSAEWLSARALQRGGFDNVTVMQEMTRRGISKTDVMDHCIARASVIVGEGWHQDTLSFWQVTLASARLYGLVKHISVEWRPRCPAIPQVAVIIVTMKGEDHIIGPAILADQLRRLGCSVCISSSDVTGGIAARLQTDAFDLALLSCGTLESLEIAALVVKDIRQKCVCAPLIGLGGSVLGQCDGILAQTGVDFLARDVTQALAMCDMGQSAAASKVVQV